MASKEYSQLGETEQSQEGSANNLQRIAALPMELEPQAPQQIPHILIFRITFFIISFSSWILGSASLLSTARALFVLSRIPYQL